MKPSYYKQQFYSTRNSPLHVISILLSLFLIISNTEAQQQEESKALLIWKESLENTSQSSLSSWTAGSNPCNGWFGIACNKAGNVSGINLTDSGLQGTLQNLNFSFFPHLLRLDLVKNSIFGTIPSTIATLSQLTYLDIGQNRLSGKIPSEINSLSKLTVLHLHENNLSGTIPRDIGKLVSLVSLALYRNNLTGLIPNSIGSLDKLTILYLYENELSGSIPFEIGSLTSLRQLDFDKNKLTGPIPTSIGKLGNLSLLYLFNNQLSGPIPQEIGLLSSLVVLALGNNSLSGQIPRTIGNLSKLTILDLNLNALSGTIPSEIGKLTNLALLGLISNHLVGSLPPEFNNIINLKELQLSNNSFSGPLPDSICLGGSLLRFTAALNNFTGPVPSSLKNCTTLTRLRLDHNRITGNLSTDFGIYPDLVYVDLSDNSFYGELSVNWGLCANLTSLKVSNNNLSGRIPPELSKATQLARLDLSSNRLSGPIPRTFEALFELDLHNNNVSGLIPPQISKLTRLQILNLAGNTLTGSIPTQLLQCLQLQILNLSRNRIGEGIPSEIGKLLSLQALDLSHNDLTGVLPKLGELESIEIIDVSHNQLSGFIESNFEGMTSLASVNISWNQFEGPLPNIKVFQEALLATLTNNKALCGNVTGLPHCPPKGNLKRNKNFKILIILPVSTTLFVFASIAGIWLYMKRRIKRKVKDEEHVELADQNMFVEWSHDGKKVYENVITATENFDSKYFIGKGGNGTVYKAEFGSGQVVAVKKFHMPEDVQISILKSFMSEVRVLTKIRHRNIVKLYGFCSHTKHSILVYEFLEGGSLRNTLSNTEGAGQFDWKKRSNVIRGVANALSYMHHDCLPPTVHRDISSNNILLDSEFEAHVADFGTAKFLKGDSSNWSSFAGTFGYAAPELAYTMEVNEKSDIYSFGVLSLEVIMGRHPGDFISSLLWSSPSSSLPSSSPLPSTTGSLHLIDLLDQHLQSPSGDLAQEVLNVIKIAILCIQENPKYRPSMKEVVLKYQQRVQEDAGEYCLKMTMGQLLDDLHLTT